MKCAPYNGDQCEVPLTMMVSVKCPYTMVISGKVPLTLMVSEKCPQTMVISDEVPPYVGGQ